MSLFVYGTLRSPDLMAAVAGPGLLDAMSAQLHGYAVHPVAGDCVPMIVASPNKVTDGLLWRGLTAAQRARLDAYELAFGYRLITVDVRTASGSTQRAEIYLPPENMVPEDGPWSLSAWEADHLQPALHAVAEIFAGGIVPSHEGLRQRWPMMEHRAWARHRAGARPRAAALRHDARPGDVSIGARDEPRGEFFRLQAFNVTHRRFDGGAPADLRREVFWGAEAALLLPYDPVRDRVLLVEQVSMGPTLLGDPNPWTLEPVAGLVDARETPLQTAHREAAEEAGLTLDTVEHIASFYPSPGGTTEYFHAYLGLCDLPAEASYLGGLEGEGEDLRLHTIPFDRAVGLMSSGEITAGPLILMMLWLAQARLRLRPAA